MNDSQQENQNENEHWLLKLKHFFIVSLHEKLWKRGGLVYV